MCRSGKSRPDSEEMFIWTSKIWVVTSKVIAVVSMKVRYCGMWCRALRYRPGCNTVDMYWGLRGSSPGRHTDCPEVSHRFSQCFEQIFMQYLDYVTVAFFKILSICLRSSRILRHVIGRLVPNVLGPPRCPETSDTILRYPWLYSK